MQNKISRPLAAKFRSAYKIRTKKIALRPFAPILSSPARAFALFCLLLFVLFSANNRAQNLPDKIRGYKVHKAKIDVKTQTDENSEKMDSGENEAFVKIGEPEIVDVSLFGITLEIPVEVESLEQSGTIDFLTFHDFRVNNLKVEVEEYKESFEFKKNEKLILPKPFRIFISTKETLRGASKEWRDSKKVWQVTGRIFVFGKFKKSIFKFKRVVPIEIDTMIENPLVDES